MTADLVTAQIRKLPPLPQVAHRLIELVKKDDCSADDVTRVLSSDQVLAGKILKLANSPFYGMAGRVATISRAVVILGFTAVRNMALGLGLTQAIKQGAGKTDLAAFWNHALHVGAAGRTVALRSGHPDPEEMLIAGLLHDLGRLILDLARPGHEQEIGALPMDRFLQAEADLVGLDHAEAGRQVARHWNLPERLGDVLGRHHHPTRWRQDASGLIAGVMLADLLARCLGQSRELPGDPPDPIDLAHHLGLPLDDTGGLLDETRHEVQKTLSFLEIAGVDTAGLGSGARTGTAPPQGCAVVLGDDDQRRGWLGGQLAHHGWQLVGMAPFLADPHAQADLAVLDPRSLPGDRIDGLLRALVTRGARPALAAPSAELEARLPGIVVLPPAIGRSDLANLAPAAEPP